MKAAHPLIRRDPARVNAGIGAWPVLVMALTVLVPAWRSQAADDPAQLGPQRWREHSYGVSLVAPSSARLRPSVSGDVIARFVGDSGYTMEVSIKKPQDRLGIVEMIDEAIQQFASVYPSAVILDNKHLLAGEKPAGAVYFRVPDPRGAWVVGQAFVQIHGRVFVMLEIEAAQHDWGPLAGLFESVVTSVECEDPQRLHQRRQERLRRGQEWLESVDPGRWRAVLGPERWYRVVENDQDVGYMRVSQYEDTRMEYDGLRVDLQSRMLIGDLAHDMISSFFCSNDDRYEEWSIRATVRPKNDPPDLDAKKQTRAGLTQASWAETGMRYLNRITVSREGPSGIHKLAWDRPPVGYLSQVHAFLTPQLLRPSQAEVKSANESGESSKSRMLGFYVYNPNSHKITYRTERTIKGQDGGYTVLSRLRPESGQQVSHHDAQGRLLRRILPNGNQLIVTTKAELGARWKFNR